MMNIQAKTSGELHGTVLTKTDGPTTISFVKGLLVVAQSLNGEAMALPLDTKADMENHMREFSRKALSSYGRPLDFSLIGCQEMIKEGSMILRDGGFRVYASTPREIGFEVVFLPGSGRVVLAPPDLQKA